MGETGDLELVAAAAAAAAVAAVAAVGRIMRASTVPGNEEPLGRRRMSLLVAAWRYSLFG